MNLEEIKSSLESGKKVFWANESYKVIKDKIGQYLVIHTCGNCVGLTNSVGILQGKESDFFTN
jgi:hypothetical protein